LGALAEFVEANREAWSTAAAAAGAGAAAAAKVTASAKM